VRTVFDHVRVFLFDLDGTLIEPSIDFGVMNQRVLQVAREFGIDTRPLADMHVLELVDYVALLLEGDHGQGAPFVSRAERLILDMELEAADRVCAYAGVPEMLEQLAARGFGIGIVTRNARLAVERVLRRIPLYHDVLLTRDDVICVKPDPRHLLKALELFPASGREAVMCGDHPMDIVAGERVCALTVGVLLPGVDEEYFAGVDPDLVLSRPSELLEYLEG